MKTPKILAALGLAAALLFSGAAQAAPGRTTVDYGSGTLGSWATASNRVDSDAVFSQSDVWVFGDSILRDDATALVGSFTAQGTSVAVDAWGSRPTAPTVDALEARLAKSGAPAVVVMAIGTNDIFDPTVMSGQIDRTMTLVPAETRVIWVNVFATRWAMGWGQRESDLRNTGWVNNQIMEAVNQYPNYSVVDWYGVLSKNPGYRITNWLTDGVHTSTLGRGARNSLIVSAVNAVT